MHALVSPDLSTSFVPIVSWYFNARTRCGGRLFEQFRAGARTVYAHPRVDGFAQVRVYTWGRFRVPSTARSHSGGKRRIWLFPSLGFFGDVIRRCPAEPRLSGPCRCGSRHRRPWLHTCHPSRRVTQITDAGNRFERHGNRAGVAARGRNPPVWCERMNGVLLTALSGSQRLSAALDSRPAAVSAQKSADRNGSHHL